MRSTFSPDLTSFAGRLLAASLVDDWVSTRAVTEQLGLTQSLAAQLMVSELAGDLADGPTRDSGDGSADRAAARGDEPAPAWVIRSGSKLLMPRSGLDLLSNVSWVDADPGPYINVRLGPGTLPDRPEDSRTYLGFHRILTAQERYDAATRWWYFTRMTEWSGRPFVASIAGFVTLTGRIERVVPHPSRDVVAFEVDVSDEHARQVFAGRRIPVHPGGPALKVQPRDA